MSTSAATSAATASPHGFRRLWTATTLSGLGDGLYLMVLPLIALTLTTDPALVAGVRVAQTAAGLAFGLFVGVLVDRFDRRRLVVGAEVLRGGAVLALAAAAAFDALSLPLVFAAAFVVGTAETVVDTAQQAMVPMVVEPDGLRRANGRIYGAQTVTNDFVGAPLGALLFAVAAVVGLAVPGGLYLAAAVVLLGLAGRYRVPRPDTTTTVRRDIREGLAVLWRQTALRRLAVYGAVAGGINMAFFAVFIVFAVGDASAMRLSPFGYSLLITAAAAGAVLGATLADRISRRLSPPVVLTAVVVALGLCFGTPALTPNPYVIGLALAGCGFIAAVGGVVSVSLRQALTPPHLIGRVGAGSRLLALAARPLGALAGGLVAAATSPRTLFVVLAVAILLIVPVTARIPSSWTGPAGDPADPGPDPAAPAAAAVPTAVVPPSDPVESVPQKGIA
ncbi:MAG TPA: MFS transporter [Pseudonocardiaceae bacterium]